MLEFLKWNVGSIFETMHIDFFFLIIVKGLLRSRILRSIFENYYTWLTFPLHIIFFSFVFCKEFIIF